MYCHSLSFLAGMQRAVCSLSSAVAVLIHRLLCGDTFHCIWQFSSILFLFLLSPAVLYSTGLVRLILGTSGAEATVSYLPGGCVVPVCRHRPTLWNIMTVCNAGNKSLFGYHAHCFPTVVFAGRSSGFYNGRFHAGVSVHLKKAAMQEK